MKPRDNPVICRIVGWTVVLLSILLALHFTLALTGDARVL